MMLADDVDTIEIDKLLENGSVAFDGITATLTRRADVRMIISFFKLGDETGWCDEICASEDFTDLHITASTPEEVAASQLEALLKALAKHPSLAGTKITLCGTRESCRLAVAIAQHFADPDMVLFDPPEITIPPHATIFFDPFTSKAKQGENTQWLKCFASNGDSAGTLTRMHLHRSVLPAALQSELDPAHFYALLRKRKDYRFYRIGVEEALTARGKSHLVPHFRDLFRTRRAAQSFEIDALQNRAAAARPATPGAWARLRGDTGPTPSAGGNVWMLQAENERLRYLSDRWRGVTMGYVEQNGITLAETRATAIGIAAFGDGQKVERPLAHRFPWHVVDARLDGTAPAHGPLAEATLSLEQLYAEHAGLVTALALGTAQSGITAGEALPGAPKFDAMIAQIETACRTLATWDKALMVDRLRLALLTGAPNTSQADAAQHYTQVATALTRDITATTGQDVRPTVVIVPQAGLRHNGTSEIALAEARFDLDNPTLDAVIPTPAYPFPLMAEMPATHTPEAALLMDEICMLALRARQNGKPWHCPQLQLAQATGTTITAHVSTMDGLVLQDGPHGFHVIGDDAPAITDVEVISDTEIKLELDTAPTKSGLHLAYAWGHRSDCADSDHSANHGALRDRWQQQSAALDGQTLHRFALHARVPLQVKN